MATITATIERHGKTFTVTTDHGDAVRPTPVQEFVDVAKVLAQDFGGQLQGLTVNGVAVTFLLPTTLIVNTTQAAVRPSTCPGCNGSGVLTDDPQVLRCESCGGIFTDPETPITGVQAMKFVAFQLDMLDNAGADGAFYFDLDVMNRGRLHGWADKRRKRVVQWG